MFLAHAALCLFFGTKLNRSLPSSKNPKFQNGRQVHNLPTGNTFYFQRITNHFYIKGWTLNLVLIQRPGVTRKSWPIQRVNTPERLIDNYITARENELNGVNSSESCSLEDGWMDGRTDGLMDGWIDSQETLLMCRSCIAWQKLQTNLGTQFIIVVYMQYNS